MALFIQQDLTGLKKDYGTNILSANNNITLILISLTVSALPILIITKSFSTQATSGSFLFGLQ